MLWNSERFLNWGSSASVCGRWQIQGCGCTNSYKTAVLWLQAWDTGQQIHVQCEHFQNPIPMTEHKTQGSKYTCESASLASPSKNISENHTRLVIYHASRAATHTWFYDTMINFGVREVANSRATAAPGWAYVPDTGLNASVAALQPSSRTRVRNQPTASLHETTAKQEAKILRELAALDRENHRDVSIPVPIRHKDNAGRGIIDPPNPG
jgi:hypothetical protein